MLTHCSQDGHGESFLQRHERYCHLVSRPLDNRHRRSGAPSFAIPPLLVKLNIRAGFVFGATAFPLTLAMWYLLPETKG